MSKRLKDLPGFDEALAYAARTTHGCDHHENLKLAGEAVIPGLGIAHGFLIEQLAILIGTARGVERRRIRLAPPPRPDAANDCEAL